MAEKYLHIEIERAQSAKTSGRLCGDVIGELRTRDATTVLCADGLGSGGRAHVFAQMCASRLFELLRQSVSLREAFSHIVRTMNEARGADLPYTAFTVARILGNGSATVLSYDAPPPILISGTRASVLSQHSIIHERAQLFESTCRLRPGDAVLLVSDGVTQAGLGAGLKLGWGIDNVEKFVNACLRDALPLRKIPACVHNEAWRLCKDKPGDDCTAVLALCRPGVTANILTGPPVNPYNDKETVQRFLASEGVKIVCGATTAQIVAREIGKTVDVHQNTKSCIAPPHYAIEGIDLVTEGAVTLNQAYNIWDIDPATYEEGSGVTELCDLLHVADRIQLFAGMAANPANASISFRQQGILNREDILPLLIKKFEDAEKLVILEYV